MRISILLTFLLLIAGFLSPSVGLSKISKYDPNKTIVDHFSKTKPTIVYIGESWCHACRNAKNILTNFDKKYENKIKIVFIESTLNMTLNVGNKKLFEHLSNIRGIPIFIVNVPNAGIVFIGNGNIKKIVKRVLHAVDKN